MIFTVLGWVDFETLFLKIALIKKVELIVFVFSVPRCLCGIARVTIYTHL